MLMEKQGPEISIAWFKGWLGRSNSKWQYTFLMSLWFILMGILTGYVREISGSGIGGNSLAIPHWFIYLGTFLIIIGILGIFISYFERYYALEETNKS